MGILEAGNSHAPPRASCYLAVGAVGVVLVSPQQGSEKMLWATEGTGLVPSFFRTCGRLRP